MKTWKELGENEKTNIANNLSRAVDLVLPEDCRSVVFIIPANGGEISGRVASVVPPAVALHSLRLFVRQLEAQVSAENN